MNTAGKTMETKIPWYESGGDPWGIPCEETSNMEQLCKRPLVSVHMQTYNHERFIRQAIEGVVMQETDFEYELIVSDDCSKDRTLEICLQCQKEHPDKIRVLWARENVCRKMSLANVNRCVIRCRGKYLAWCEGDDYWTDPKKLQKQVEYMESHPGCAGCFHERVIAHADGQSIPGTGWPEAGKRKMTGDDIALREYPLPATCTVMYRREVLMERPPELNAWKAGDLATALWAGYHHGTIDWVEGVKPSVYRIHSGGIFSGCDRLTKYFWGHEHYIKTMEFFPVPPPVVQLIHQKMEEEVFGVWVRWHGSDSASEQEELQKLIRLDVAAWPILRWRLLMRQIGYWQDRGRTLAWHGLVLGVKGILPERLYQWGRRRWKGVGK